MITKELSRHRQLESGSYVRLTKEVTNNTIKLKPLDEGKIVYAKNQVEADIWFYNERGSDNAIGLDTSFNMNGRFEGIVLNVKGNSFSVKFDFEKHVSIVIEEEDALQIPFFQKWDDKRIAMNYWKNEIQQFEYYLNDIIEYIEDAFENWIDKELETRQVTEQEKENGDYPEEFDYVFTNESQTKLNDKQQELELKFAQITGFYYHFLGGTTEA